MDNIPEALQSTPSTNIWKELLSALKIIGLKSGTILSVSQSRPALKYGLVFVLLPNIVLLVLILLSGVRAGFADFAISLGQTFFIIELSFLVAKFLFKGQGTIGGYFRPASYSFIFLALIPLIISIYYPLPVAAQILALAVFLLGLWNVVVLSKVLQQTQGLSMSKSLASVLISLVVLSLAVPSPENLTGKPTQQDQDLISDQMDNRAENNYASETHEELQQYDNKANEQSIVPVPQSFEAITKPVSTPDPGPTIDDINRETVMGGMSTQIMHQISNGIWSGNYYNPWAQ